MTLSDRAIRRINAAIKRGDMDTSYDVAGELQAEVEAGGEKPSLRLSEAARGRLTILASTLDNEAIGRAPPKKKKTAKKKPLSSAEQNRRLNAALRGK